MKDNRAVVRLRSCFRRRMKVWARRTYSWTSIAAQVPPLNLSKLQLTLCFPCPAETVVRALHCW